MDSISVNPESVACVSGNPMRYTGLDHIHTAHINNLISVLLDPAFSAEGVSVDGEMLEK